jgi:hypothetical protein
MKKSFTRYSHARQYGSTFLWGSTGNSLKNPPDSAGQKALDELKEWCDQKKYKEILERLRYIEKEFPSCAKAATYYRGLAKYEILKESGNLLHLTHMKQ